MKPLENNYSLHYKRDSFVSQMENIQQCTFCLPDFLFFFFHKYSWTSGLSPRGHLERQAEVHASTQDEAWLSCPQSAGTLRSESEIRGTLRFLPQLEMRPSSNAPSPVKSREAPPTSSFPGFSEPPWEGRDPWRDILTQYVPNHLSQVQLFATL